MVQDGDWLVSFLGKEYRAKVSGQAVNINGKIYQLSHPKLKLLRLAIEGLKKVS